MGTNLGKNEGKGCWGNHKLLTSIMLYLVAACKIARKDYSLSGMKLVYPRSRDQCLKTPGISLDSKVCYASLLQMYVVPYKWLADINLTQKPMVAFGYTNSYFMSDVNSKSQP